jgi:hypothetical protein
VRNQMETHLTLHATMSPDVNTQDSARRIYTKATEAFLESSLVLDQRSSTYDDAKILDLWGAFVEGWAARGLHSEEL